MKMPRIAFNLDTICAPDEDTKAWVGYIPSLRLFATARNEERLQESLRQTACSFIGLCWHRKILDRVMEERGMRKLTTEATEKIKQADGQYVTVGNVAQDASEIYREVPAALLAGKKAMIECRH